MKFRLNPAAFRHANLLGEGRRREGGERREEREKGEKKKKYSRKGDKRIENRFLPRYGISGFRFWEWHAVGEDNDACRCLLMWHNGIRRPRFVAAVIANSRVCNHFGVGDGGGRFIGTVVALFKRATSCRKSRRCDPNDSKKPFLSLSLYYFNHYYLNRNITFIIYFLKW